MPRRAIPADPSIGERIRARRQLRGWSMRFAASRAGISHVSWSRLERGEQRADRYLIADIAAALECPVTELTGQPPIPADRELEAAHARVVRIWQALIEIAPDEPPNRPAVPVAALIERAALVEERRLRCDYAGVGQLLPDLLLDLHASAKGRDSQAALRLLVTATNTARGVLAPLGYLAEAAFAAERCRQIAEQVDHPVLLAFADRCRAMAASASGSFRRTLTLAERASNAIAGHTENGALEIRGALHLSAALGVLAERRIDDAMAHLDEADRIAARSGPPIWGTSFGTANVRLWKMGLLIDAGEPGRAIEVAKEVDLSQFEHKDRPAIYYVDLARALADLGGQRDREAIRMLLTAERTAPQRVRSYVGAREVTRHLLNRARRAAGGTELRGLCERMRVPL